MGRPPIFNKPEELQKKVDEYFEYVKGEINPAWIEMEKSNRRTGISTEPPLSLNMDIEEWKREPEKVTITGLVLYLGFCDRSSFYKYGEKKEFRHTIKKAHSRIENHYENMLQGQNVAGPIFALKNLQWKDKTETEVTLHTEQPLFPDVHPDKVD